jgi:hypothetical protein
MAQPSVTELAYFIRAIGLNNSSLYLCCKMSVLSTLMCRDRCFSLGEVLKRVWDLHEETALFLEIICDAQFFTFRRLKFKKKKTDPAFLFDIMEHKII